MGLRLRTFAAVLALTGSAASAQEMLTYGTAGAYLAARQAASDHNFREAANYYRQALAREPNYLPHIENALTANLSLGNYGEATQLARTMVEAGSTGQIPQMMALTALGMEGRYRDMVARFQDGTQVGPLVDGLLLGWALIGTGDTEAGLNAFDTIAERDGLRAFALHHKALALANVGDFEAAEAIYSGEAEGDMPPNRRGLLARTKVLSQLDRNADAVGQIDQHMGGELDATFSDLRRRLVAGEPLAFTDVETAADGMAEVFYTVATALDGEASNEYALLYSRVAEALNPTHIDALLLSAKFLEDLGRPELATGAYDRVPRTAPEYVTAELGRADALFASDRPDAAVEALEQLGEAHPDRAAIHTKLGDTLRRMERYGDAITAYDDALALQDDVLPEHWFTYFARGICHEREDNWDAAEADLRMALELRPNQPQVMNYLGYSLVEKHMKLDEALELIEAAATLRPDNGHILDSLGWVLYRLGRYDEAVGPMETAVELMATDPIINDHLGDVYWAVGRYTEAHFQWQRALSFEPEDDEALRIRRKLDVGLDLVLEEEGMAPIAVATDG